MPAFVGMTIWGGRQAMSAQMLDSQWFGHCLWVDPGVELLLRGDAALQGGFAQGQVFAVRQQGGFR